MSQHKLVIRFDGPPSHESGRFIEVELDGASVSYGEWEQDGDDWLLVLPDADAKNAQARNILDDPFPESIYPQLSPLERNIAKMTVIDGMTAQEIADALDSSVSTVNSYRRMVYKAFGFRTHRWPSLVFDRIREVLKDE